MSYVISEKQAIYFSFVDNIFEILNDTEANE